MLRKGNTEEVDEGKDERNEKKKGTSLGTREEEGKEEIVPEL